METLLTSFSNELTNLVQRISPSVVAVHARRHFPSSGVHWGPDLVVTADHTVAREEDIRVTLADGKSLTGSLLGRDPGADLAALRALPIAERPRGRRALAPNTRAVLARASRASTLRLVTSA